MAEYGSGAVSNRATPSARRHTAASAPSTARRRRAWLRRILRDQDARERQMAQAGPLEGRDGLLRRAGQRRPVKVQARVEDRADPGPSLERLDGPVVRGIRVLEQYLWANRVVGLVHGAPQMLDAQGCRRK